MRLSNHFNENKSHLCFDAKLGKRGLTVGPVRPLPAPFDSSEDERDDGVLTGVAAAESFERDLPSPLVIAPNDIFDPLRDEVSSWIRDLEENAKRGASVNLTAHFWDDFSDSCVVSPSSCTSSPLPRRHVSFEGLATVLEIRSHRSMSKEEKQRLYREKSTRNEDTQTSSCEQSFEGSWRCSSNVFEENLFFPDHLGSLVHPAHFLSFVRYVYPTLPSDTVVPGFASFDLYDQALLQYAHFYDKLVQTKVFPSSRS